MQKIIKLETENTTIERWTENSACEIYSHDTNNGHFEIEVMNEALTDETVTALFIFEESESVWRTTGIIEENKIKFKFDTTLITQDETVVCVLYLDNERENNDFYRFSFKVKISEIDKLDKLTIKERLFKNNLIIDRLEVVTKDELKEALKNLDLSSISTEGLLTEEKANGLYAKISELEAVESKIITQEQLTSTKNEVVTEINNRLENYALKTNIPEPYNDTSLVSRVSDLERKTDKDTIYDDSDLKARISVLENREDKNTIYDDTSVRERLTVLENKPNVDISNLATKEELNEVRNSQPTVDTSHLVTREELEEKHFLTTHQDLSEYAKKSEIPQPYNDSALAQKIGQLEARVDNDTIYNDTEVKHRLTELENKPVVDTSVFVTDEKLSNYALKSELPTPYNDNPLNERVTALESKAIEGGGYDDSDLRNRVTNLESIDTSKFVTDEKLESKGYLKSHQDITGLATKEEIANLVTNDQLEAKHYITGAALENYALKSDIPQGYNDTEVKERLTVLENKQDKDTVYNDAELRNRVSELEQRPIATPYNDTALSDRVSALETKQDNDTVYNDEPIKERLTALENKANIDLTGYATKQELKNKVDNSDYDTFKGMVVTKGYLESKNYLTEQYNDKPLTDRVVALESKPSVDLSNYVTKQELHEATEIDYSNIVTTDELEEKHYLTANDITNLATKQELQDKVSKSDFDTLKADVVNHTELADRHYLTETIASETYAKKSELPTPYNDSALISRVSALESKQDKDTVYNDTEVKQRLTALESRPTGSGGLGTEDVATYSNTIIFVPNGNIVYDKNLKKLHIPKCNVQVGKTSYWCEAQEVSLNGSAGFIVFNKAQKRIVAGSVNSTNDVLLGYYDNNIGNYYLNTFSKALKKKKIACLGDSITEGVNANGWQWHRYIDKYFKENGVETTIVNLGIGGTSVCTSSYVTASLQPFVNRLNTIPTDTDVIVIFGGTNDWGNNASLGTISDSGSSSFYGAYKYMLEWFANNRPNAKILTITPLKRYYRGNTSTWTNAQTTRNNKGQLLQDYVRAVKEVSEMYAIPCVDLHNESGLNPVLEIVRTKYMGDGLHPTAEGNKKMYPIILNKLKPLVEYD